MKLGTALRFSSWVLFAAGVLILYTSYDFMVRNAMQEPLGWVAIGSILGGLVASLISTALRVFPRRKEE